MNTLTLLVFHFRLLSLFFLRASALTVPITFAEPQLQLGLAPPTNTTNATRLDRIKNMYAWEGFVYTLSSCPSLDDMVYSFSRMRSMGVRNIITFDYCGTGADAEYYGLVIKAAGLSEMYIIPLAWTLVNDGENFERNAIPRIQAVTEAVIRNPDPVLAVALGDEPLYDYDFGTANNLAKYVVSMRDTFTQAGVVDMPLSISEMAYGWQISGDITALADVLDFFMINTFPFFAPDSKGINSSTTWDDFTRDIAYYESIAGGKPLLVTQTGWPSNQNTWSPNSPDVVASVQSEQSYWDLLDSHCEDFFKEKNVGWMWRNWDDNIDGWGALYNNGTEKWELSARVTC